MNVPDRNPDHARAVALSHEDLGRALDSMQESAKHAQHEGEAAAALLGGYRAALRGQQVHLNRLLAQIDSVRDQITALDRWHDDGGKP